MKHPVAFLPDDADIAQVRKVLNEVIQVVRDNVGDDRKKLPTLENRSRVAEGEMFLLQKGVPLFHSDGKFYRVVLEEFDTDYSVYDLMKGMRAHIDELKTLFPDGEEWSTFFKYLGG